MWNVFLVGTGGGIGAVLRYGISMGLKSVFPGYAAAGTLFVNVVGSLAIGYLLGTPHDQKSVSESTRLFAAVGILGGLTTFSSLTHETATLVSHHEGNIAAGLGHLTANVVLGLAAIWTGAWLGRGIVTT